MGCWGRYLRAALLAVGGGLGALLGATLPAAGSRGASDSSGLHGRDRPPLHGLQSLPSDLFFLVLSAEGIQCFCRNTEHGTAPRTRRVYLAYVLLLCIVETAWYTE